MNESKTIATIRLAGELDIGRKREMRDALAPVSYTHLPIGA